MRKKSIGINAVLNLIKVASTILFPLITFPYISRVLQVDNVGRINYGTSVVNYFALVAALGVNIYGVREGSRQKKGKQFDSFASEVFSLNLLSTAISYLTLITLVLTVPKFRDYRSVILILSLSIVLTTFGIEWVNTVFEDYLYITLRSLVVQILCMVAMFVIIKKPEDYLKYALITVASSGITCVANWIYCRRYTKLCLVFNASIFRHLRPMLIFFANHLAITIYVTADTTMLGWMKGDFYSGLYAVSVKVYQCVKSMTAAEATCHPGGVIIECAACADGHGGQSFYESLRDCESAEALYAQFMATPQEETIADQWESQILARMLKKHTIIMVTRPELKSMVEDMKMRFAPTLEEAVDMARAMGKQSMTVIPNGISVIVRQSGTGG